MNDATNDNRTLRTLKGLAGYTSFVSTVVGVIATIVKRTTEIYQRAQDAWPILGPLTFYVGIAAIMTFFFTFAIFRPIVHGVTRNPAVRAAALMIIVPVFGVMELAFALKEGGYDTADSIRLGAQIVGAVVLLIGCYAAYRFIRSRA